MKNNFLFGILFVFLFMVCLSGFQPKIVLGFDGTGCETVTCGGSGTYDTSECKQSFIDGSWYCSTSEETKDCHRCWVNSVMVGCQFVYWYKTCTKASCQAYHSDGDTIKSGTYTCCTANPGVCNNGGSYCINPGNCTSGGAVNKSSSGGNWTWKCLGSGSCGSLSGQCMAGILTPQVGAAGDCNNTATSNSYCAYGNIPTKCDVGSPTVVKDNFTDGIKWTCSGTTTGEVCGGGVGATVNCSTTKKTPVKGDAGKCNANATSTSYCAYANIPTKCDVGSATLVSDDISGGIKWTCSGTTTGEVCGGGAGATVNCGTTKIAPITRVDGVCSGINNTVVQAKPSSGLCNTGTPSPVPVNTSLTTYSWTCYGTNGVCPASTAINRPCSATQDTPPVPVAPIPPVPPGITDPTPNPSGGVRLNSCQFNNPNLITFSFSVSDTNGIGDIAGVYFRFKGIAIEYGPMIPNTSGVVTFNNIDISSLPDGTYTIQAKANDIHYADIGSAWVDLVFQFKKWNCEVAVDGTIYDNSANLACVNGSNQGFGTTIPANIKQFTLAYGDRTPGGSTRNMTVVSPGFSSPDTLTWQNQYFLDTINTTNISFLGLFNRSKINDICVDYDEFVSPKDYVNAYDASPKIDIKYSAVMDQEAWFRVKDGSVLADVKAQNYVPVTCVDNCKTTLQGLVWSKNVNLSDSDESLTSEAQPQPPFKEYYESLKYDINGGLNVGTTINGSVDWSDIGSTRGVIFVSGDLTIDQDMVPTANDYVFFIVKGRIIIANTVTQVNGMFYTDTTIEAMGENDTQLKISGSLYGRSGVNLSRSYVTKRKNNTIPAVEVTFDPNLIFRLPKKLWELYENWTLE